MHVIENVYHYDIAEANLISLIDRASHESRTKHALVIIASRQVLFVNAPT